MTFDLTGRVALVTGGASGIGAGICKALAEAGAKVVIADRDLAGAEAVAADLGGEALALDLADEASIRTAAAKIVAQHGAPWVLVNNAGVQDRELLAEGSAPFWDRTHAINARGPYLLIAEVAQAMIAAGTGGRIVNIGSVSLIGGLIQGLGAYVASKGALQALTQAAAFELAPHGITVNLVNPGGVATPGAIHAKGPPPEGPGRRRGALGFCEPADIAAAVLFFAAPAARYVTNQTITVDGGWSVS
jgi:NAD(P)-dependent dehydrogenase (short-subunit alcohol dehydrogenase family)